MCVTILSLLNVTLLFCVCVFFLYPFPYPLSLLQSLTMETPMPISTISNGGAISLQRDDEYRERMLRSKLMDVHFMLIGQTHVPAFTRCYFCLLFSFMLSSTCWSTTTTYAYAIYSNCHLWNWSFC